MSDRMISWDMFKLRHGIEPVRQVFAAMEFDGRRLAERMRAVLETTSQTLRNVASGLRKAMAEVWGKDEGLVVEEARLRLGLYRPKRVIDQRAHWTQRTVTAVPPLATTGRVAWTVALRSYARK